MKLKFSIVCLAILLSACAGPLTKKELAEIRTIGVLNTFPQYPNYTTIGTTIFNNKYDRVNDPSYYQFLTSEMIDQLQSKGYKARQVFTESDAKVDLIMKIIPRDVYNMTDTEGYGFYQRTMFGVKGVATSYVALNLTPVTNGESRCHTCYGQSLTKLPIDGMPHSWGELSVREKNEFEAILKEDISKVITSTLPKTGL